MQSCTKIDLWEVSLHQLKVSPVTPSDHVSLVSRSSSHTAPLHGYSESLHDWTIFSPGQWWCCTWCWSSPWPGQSSTHAGDHLWMQTVHIEDDHKRRWWPGDEECSTWDRTEQQSHHGNHIPGLWRWAWRSDASWEDSLVWGTLQRCRGSCRELLDWVSASVHHCIFQIVHDEASHTW